MKIYFWFISGLCFSSSLFAARRIVLPAQNNPWGSGVSAYVTFHNPSGVTQDVTLQVTGLGDQAFSLDASQRQSVDAFTCYTDTACTTGSGAMSGAKCCKTKSSYRNIGSGAMASYFLNVGSNGNPAAAGGVVFSFDIPTSQGYIVANGNWQFFGNLGNVVLAMSPLNFNGGRPF